MLSNEELLLNDEKDPTTKRGAKFQKEKDRVRRLAKVQVIILLTELILYTWLRLAGAVPNEEICNGYYEQEVSYCKRINYHCLSNFDTFYTVHALLMFFHSGFYLKIGCFNLKTTLTLRELKMRIRNLNLFFGIFF